MRNILQFKLLPVLPLLMLLGAGCASSQLMMPVIEPITLATPPSAVRVGLTTVEDALPAKSLGSIGGKSIGKGNQLSAYAHNELGRAILKKGYNLTELPAWEALLPKSGAAGANKILKVVITDAQLNTPAGSDSLDVEVTLAVEVFDTDLMRIHADSFKGVLKKALVGKNAEQEAGEAMAGAMRLAVKNMVNDSRFDQALIK